MIHWTELQWNVQSCHGLWAQQDSSKGKGEIQGLCHPFCESLRSYTAELKPPREDEQGSARCAAGAGSRGPHCGSVRPTVGSCSGSPAGNREGFTWTPAAIFGCAVPTSSG